MKFVDENIFYKSHVYILLKFGLVDEIKEKN